MITVIGWDGGSLGADGSTALRAATLVAGAARVLAAVDVPAAARVVEMGDVRDAVAALVAHDGAAVAFASGDPGFFGLVRRLRAAGVEPRVHPAVSSVAHAFARVALPWDDAVVVSAHGRDPRPALAAARAAAKAAVLTDPATGPSEVARSLDGLARTVVVCERLGAPDERVTRLPAADVAARADWLEPNVVLVLDESRVDSGCGDPGWVAGARPVHSGWALPDEAFEHRASMVTKAEVRAVALARLGPSLGTVVWDVGAGSGSVAVECARLGAAVVAVERDPEQSARVRRNAAAHGVAVQVVAAAAPEALDALPDPDAVFVGGGGLAAVTAVAGRRPARVVVALAAVERVGPVASVLGSAGYTVDGVQLQASRLAPLPDGTHRLAATNPVILVCGTRP